MELKRVGAAARRLEHPERTVAPIAAIDAGGLALEGAEMGEVVRQEIGRPHERVESRQAAAPQPLGGAALDRRLEPVVHEDAPRQAAELVQLVLRLRREEDRELMAQVGRAVALYVVLGFIEIPVRERVFEPEQRLPRVLRQVEDRLRLIESLHRLEDRQLPFETQQVADDRAAAFLAPLRKDSTAL